MTIPSREVLNEEFAQLFVSLNKENIPDDFVKLQAACTLSYKYKLDITKCIWNILGWPTQKYKHVLPLFRENGVHYYQENSILV